MRIISFKPGHDGTISSTGCISGRAPSIIHLLSRNCPAPPLELGSIFGLTEPVTQAVGIKAA